MVVVMNFTIFLVINIVFFYPIIYRGPRFLLCNRSICQKNGRFPGICVALPQPTLQEVVISRYPQQCL